MLAAGCASPAPAAWVDETADDHWELGVSTDAAGPLWTAQEVADQVDLGLSLGFPTPQVLLADYTELLSHGDETCPGSEFEGGFVMLGGCSTADGYRFSGAAGVSALGWGFFLPCRESL